MPCKLLWHAGAARFLSTMNHGDVLTMSAQLQRSRLLEAASQLVGLARYGLLLMYTAPDQHLSAEYVAYQA